MTLRAAIPAILLIFAQPAAAVETSPLPPPRPDAAAEELIPVPAPRDRLAGLPVGEPADSGAEPAAEPGHDPAVLGDPARMPLPEGPAPVEAPVPEARGDAPEETLALMAAPEIVPGIPQPGAALPPAGTFCRDPRLVGSVLPTFVGTAGGCGIQGPVEITAAAGIAFTRAAKIDCITARAVADWIMGVVQPAAREVFDSRVTRINVVGSYVCRTRNHVPGARISEHGKGRAIDIAAFTLADGRRITVEDGWHAGATRTFLRRVWRGACGAFGTVLGPDSDRHHRDHFHLDTARYRSGAYCR